MNMAGFIKLFLVRGEQYDIKKLGKFVFLFIRLHQQFFNAE